MRRSKPRDLRLALAPAVLLFAVGAGAAGGQVWPEPPAEPVARLLGVVDKLSGFELAVQGPTGGASRSIQKLKRPSGVAFDARGRLIVSDSRQGAVLQIDPDLGVVLVFGRGTEPRLSQPMGVALDPAGVIYVADPGLRRVVAFDAQGEVESVYGNDGLAEPTDVALSPNGKRLYVADTRAHAIAVYDVTTGQRLETLGGRGKGVGEFYAPTAVEFDDSGSLLVVDQLNNRVQIFDATGAFTRAIYGDRTAGPSRPSDVTRDAAGRLFVTDLARSHVRVYDADLEPLFELGRNGMSAGEFLGIGAVAASGDRLAVVDQAGGRVQIFQLYGVEPQVPPNEPAAVEIAAAPTPEPPPKPQPEPEQEPESGAQPDVVPEAASERPTAVAPDAEDEMPAADDVSESAEAAQRLLQLVNEWAAAWSAQDVERYLGCYASSFEPEDGASRDAWAAGRRQRLTAPSSIAVAFEVVETRLDDSGAQMTLLQSYASDSYSDRVRKTLHFVQEDGGWKIARETVLETLRAP